MIGGVVPLAIRAPAKKQVIDEAVVIAVTVQIEDGLSIGHFDDMLVSPSSLPQFTEFIADRSEGEVGELHHGLVFPLCALNLGIVFANPPPARQRNNKRNRADHQKAKESPFPGVL